jgi:hypothetical protein
VLFCCSSRVVHQKLHTSRSGFGKRIVFVSRPQTHLVGTRNHRRKRNDHFFCLAAILMALSTRRPSHLPACFPSSFSLPGRSGLRPSGTTEFPNSCLLFFCASFCSKTWPLKLADPAAWLPNDWLELSLAVLPVNLWPCDFPDDSRACVGRTDGSGAGVALACGVF